jgi:hypothetical protein
VDVLPSRKTLYFVTAPDVAVKPATGFTGKDDAGSFPEISGDISISGDTPASGGPAGSGAERESARVGAAEPNPRSAQERTIPRTRKAGGIERKCFTENYLSLATISFSIQ